MVYEYVSLHVHAHAHTRDRTFLLHKEFARQIKSPPGVLVKRDVTHNECSVTIQRLSICSINPNPLPLPRQFVRVLESPKVGLRLCKCAPTVLSPKTLKRQPHEQAPRYRYSRWTFLAIYCTKPRTLVLYVTVFGLRRCRYPRSTSLRTPHTGGIASRVTPVSRAACSYPGHLQFHVHVPEGLKPGTQSRFCCSTLHAVSACRRWKPKAGHISPQNSSPLACSGIISLAARCTALLTVLCSPWAGLTQPLSLSSLSQDQPGTRRSRPFDHSVRANSELDAARAPARRLV